MYKTKQSCFGDVIRKLQDPKRKGKVKFACDLQKLSPFAKDDLLTVGGRIEQSLLSYDGKHQFILPAKAFHSFFLTRDVHD